MEGDGERESERETERETKRDGRSCKGRDLMLDAVETHGSKETTSKRGRNCTCNSLQSAGPNVTPSRPIDINYDSPLAASLLRSHHSLHSMLSTKYSQSPWSLQLQRQTSLAHHNSSDRPPTVTPC